MITNPKQTNDLYKVCAKYVHLKDQILDLNENPTYVQESALLVEKYPDTTSVESMLGHGKLMAKYIPGYEPCYEEIKKILMDQS